MKIPKACVICGKRAKRISLEDGISACLLHYKALKEKRDVEEVKT